MEMLTLVNKDIVYNIYSQDICILLTLYSLLMEDNSHIKNIIIVSTGLIVLFTSQKIHKYLPSMNQRVIHMGSKRK